jgi:hypothetical protein
MPAVASGGPGCPLDLKDPRRLLFEIPNERSNVANRGKLGAIELTGGKCWQIDAKLELGEQT